MPRVVPDEGPEVRRRRHRSNKRNLSHHGDLAVEFWFRRLTRCLALGRAQYPLIRLGDAEWPMERLYLHGVVGGWATGDLSMLILTEAASACLAEKLAGRSSDGDVALRFVRRSTRRGWNIRLDKPRLSDAKFWHDGRIVLVLDEVSSKLLRDRTLDIRETGDGSRLQLRRQQV